MIRKLLATAAVGGLAAIGATACEPEAFVDILRVDCAPDHQFDVKTSSSEGYTLRLYVAEDGTPVAERASGGTQTTRIFDFHPTQGGHIRNLEAELRPDSGPSAATSGAVNTPTC